jgi:hypothetical protein
MCLTRVWLCAVGTQAGAKATERMVAVHAEQGAALKTIGAEFEQLQDELLKRHTAAADAAAARHAVAIEVAPHAVPLPSD